jgi:hypothetical protein
VDEVGQTKVEKESEGLASVWQSACVLHRLRATSTLGSFGVRHVFTTV